jgi:hypothetical protein
LALRVLGLWPSALQVGGVPILLQALQQGVAAARAFAIGTADGGVAADSSVRPVTAPARNSCGLAYLLHLAANVAELPAGRLELSGGGGSGGAGAVVRDAAAVAASAAAGEGEAAVALRKAAGDATRLLGFTHWPQ